MTMSPFAYYVAWLLVGLVLVAAVSAGLTRLMRRREQALVLAEALARHAVWVAAQRSRTELEPQRQEADAALQQASTVQARWFPRLAPDLAAVMAIDQRLEAFMDRQHKLRVSDPEAWLESDHDERFMGLWREYLVAVEGVTGKLRQVTGEAMETAEQAQG